MAHELRLASQLVQDACENSIGGALSWLAWFFQLVYLTLVHVFDFFARS